MNDHREERFIKGKVRTRGKRIKKQPGEGT